EDDERKRREEEARKRGDEDEIKRRVEEEFQRRVEEELKRREEEELKRRVEQEFMRRQDADRVRREQEEIRSREVFEQAAKAPPRAGEAGGTDALDFTTLPAAEPERRMPALHPTPRAAPDPGGLKSASAEVAKDVRGKEEVI